eukprot:2909977-Rhodomonas_salina.2
MRAADIEFAWPCCGDRMKARIDALTKHANIARVRLFEEHQEVRIRYAPMLSSDRRCSGPDSGHCRYLTEQLQRAFEKIRDLEMVSTHGPLL